MQAPVRCRPVLGLIGRQLEARLECRDPRVSECGDVRRARSMMEFGAKTVAELPCSAWYPPARASKAKAATTIMRGNFDMLRTPGWTHRPMRSLACERHAERETTKAASMSLDRPGWREAPHQLSLNSHTAKTITIASAMRSIVFMGGTSLTAQQNER